MMKFTIEKIFDKKPLFFVLIANGDYELEEVQQYFQKRFSTRVLVEESKIFPLVFYITPCDNESIAILKMMFPYKPY